VELEEVGEKINYIMIHKNQYTLHPWHGVSLGDNVPDECVAFIEIVPTDTIKYEIDKESGLLKVDRPQRFSNIVPALYGFFPQTYCGDVIAQHCMEKTSREGIVGDGDPLDICVFTERVIDRSGILVDVIPIGGFRMIDNNEADDKIICILKGDDVFASWKDICQVPEGLINRLKHYFLTYKNLPSDESKKVEIESVYGAVEAKEIIEKSRIDYAMKFNQD